ncbi:hypothetical protein DW66_1703 [Pseudomonas putida]|nr:hypothetical protein DW66_1703 [Pseudomonas putida]
MSHYLWKRVAQALQGMHDPCRSGFTREAGAAVYGTGCAGVRG